MRIYKIVLHKKFSCVMFSSAYLHTRSLRCYSSTQIKFDRRQISLYNKTIQLVGMLSCSCSLIFFQKSCTFMLSMGASHSEKGFVCLAVMIVFVHKNFYVLYVVGDFQFLIYYYYTIYHYYFCLASCTSYVCL